MNFKKLEPIEIENPGCLNCSKVSQKLDMNRYLMVGFGSCNVSNGNECIYDEQDVICDDYPQAKCIEEHAKLDPDRDWRISFYGALSEEVYQRHGENEWVLIENGPGFA